MRVNAEETRINADKTRNNTTDILVYMRESIESSVSKFVRPDIKKERGEFERVAHIFNVDADTLMFLAQDEGVLQPLMEDMWEQLDNTDSNTFKHSDQDVWNKVRDCSEVQEVKRDWEGLKRKMQNKETLDAPIIFKYGDRYHLIAGNTRLMVARALGIIPTVLLFEYKEDRSNEQ